MQRGAETRRRRKADRTCFEVKCGCEQSTFQHVLCMYMVYTCIYLYIPCWTLNTDLNRIWMQDTTVGSCVVYAVMLHEQFMGWVDLVVKCGCEQSTFQHVHCMYIVYTCIYLYIPCWTLNTDFNRIWMQDTTVGAWVVCAEMLHEQPAIGPDL